MNEKHNEEGETPPRHMKTNKTHDKQGKSILAAWKQIKPVTRRGLASLTIENQEKQERFHPMKMTNHMTRS